MEIEASQINVGGGKILLLDLLSYLHMHNRPCVVWLGYPAMKREIDDTFHGFFDTRKTSPLETFVRYCRRRTSVLFFCSFPPLRRCSDSLTYIHNLHLLKPLKEIVLSEGKKGRGLVRSLLSYCWMRWGIGNTPYVGCQTKYIQNAILGNLNTRAILLPFYQFPQTEEKEKLYDFCYVALGAPHKNHERLLEAIQLLDARGKECSLVLTIPPNDTPELYTKIQDLSLRLKNVKIINKGRISRSDVFELYAQTCFLVFPSCLETLGLPLIEAVSCGVKVLASDLEYAHDSVSNLVPFNPQSSEDICEKMENALSGQYEKIVQEIKIQNKIQDIISILDHEYEE